jgi:hypothetical protein
MATDAQRHVAPDANGRRPDVGQLWQRTAADWEWLRTDPDVLAEHAGRWICVVGQRVAISEQDDAAFEQRLAESSLLSQAPLIMRVPLPDEWRAAPVQ